MNERLKAHAIDRDPDWPEAAKRYDGFFSAPDVNGAIHVWSIGPIDEAFHGGLFVDVHIFKSQGEWRQAVVPVVSLQTAKIAEVVNKDDALWLSRREPEQLRALAAFIRAASPISPEAYAEFMKPLEDPQTTPFLS